MIPQSTPVPPPTFNLKAPRQPMLWAALAYSLAIIAGIYLWRPAQWWTIAITAFVAAATYFARRRSGVGWLLALAAFFLAGALHIQLRGASTRFNTSIQPYADRQELQIAALHHPSANLVKLGHHGSNNATTPELLASACPQFTIISVGSGNSFGLPRMETHSRLADAGARVYRTDLDGAVTSYLDGHSVTPTVAALQ